MAIYFAARAFCVFMMARRTSGSRWPPHKFHDAIWFILSWPAFSEFARRPAGAPRRARQRVRPRIRFAGRHCLLWNGNRASRMPNPLKGIPQLGWMIAFVYLACGALHSRLIVSARMAKSPSRGRRVLRVPIPAAASHCLDHAFMLWLNEDADDWQLEVCAQTRIAFSVVHDVQQVSLSQLQGDQLAHDAIGATFLIPDRVDCRDLLKFYQWMAAILFLLYLLYGLPCRPAAPCSWPPS